MSNIFYKLFYMLFANFSKYSKYEDENSFPLLSIGILAVLLDLNFILLTSILDDLFKYSITNTLGSKPDIFIIALFFIIFSFFIGRKKKYKKIFKYYKEKKFETKLRNELIFWLYIGVSIALPIIYGFLRKFVFDL